MKIFNANTNTFNNYLHSPLQIGSVLLRNRLALAPLAGTSETVFRTICVEFGAGLVTTELVSARGICHDPDLIQNYSYLEIQPELEPQVSIQLFGHDPRDFARAAQIVLEHPVLGQCSFIDINMGCPVKKVVRDGAGAALMKTPDLAAEIVRTVAQIAADFGKKVTAKIRAGWDQTTCNAASLAELLVKAGAVMLTVHARTREQMYAGKADWSIIKNVKKAVAVPVFGNGDLTDFASLQDMYEQTGCSGFAIGRAALGNPFIFRDILESDQTAAGRTSPEEWLAVIERHIDGIISREKSERIAIIKMRSQFAAYLKGIRNGASFRKQVMGCFSKQEVMAVIKAAASQ